jgi:DNA-binding transcriptional ArsR family regulator
MIIHQEVVMNEHQRAAQLAQALADPLRLTVLRHLMAGPATVAELMSLTGATQSNISNHLAVLRAQNFVDAERAGRQMIYRIADPTVAQLVESLIALAGESPRLARPVAPLAAARTCYDHLAGTVGVALFDALIAQDAIRAPDLTGDPSRLGPSGAITLGPAAGEVFGELGVDLVAVNGSKRQFAYACRDWTERRFHLGGALGAALCRRFRDAGWMMQGSEQRQLSVTPAGRDALRQMLGITLDT